VLKFKKIMSGLAILILLNGCGSNALLQRVTPINSSLEKYNNVIVIAEGKNESIKKAKGFHISRNELESEFITSLAKKNKFRNVSSGSTGNHESGTLLIKLVIEELDYLSGASSYFFGVFSGNSSLKVLAKLLDAKTGVVIGEIRSFAKTNSSGGVFRGGTAGLITKVSDKLVEDILSY